MNNDKLIKQGILYSDKVFEVIKERVLRDLKNSKDLKDFLARTKEFTVENPLVSTGYVETMTNLVMAGVSSSEYLRGQQRELVRTAIQEATAQLIVKVGEDLKQQVRDTVKTGYDQGLSNEQISKELTKNIDTINRTRARVIARTETSRASTISDYVVHKDRGATGFTVSCRPDCCPICAEDYANITTPSYASNYNQIQSIIRKLKVNPRRDDASDLRDDLVSLDNAQSEITGSTGGKLIGGERVFSMSNTDMLPPRHPSCRCSANYVYSNAEDIRSQITREPSKISTTKPSTTKTVKETSTSNNPLLENLTEDELKSYNKAQKMLQKASKQLEKLADKDPRRIKYENQIKSAKRSIKRYEDLASKPSNRKTVEQKVIKRGDKTSNLKYEQVTSYEDMADYFGLTYIKEITTQSGIKTVTPVLYDEKYEVSFLGMDKFDIDETKEVLRSYDKTNPLLKSVNSKIYMNPNTDGRTLGDYNPSANIVTIYTHKWDNYPATIEYTVTHEMAHAFDNMLSPDFAKQFSQESSEYRKLQRNEGWSSRYSYQTKGATRIMEDFAETASMVLNKNNPNVKIRLQDKSVVTAKKWCEMFPKKTAYFEKLLKSEKAQKLLGG